MTNKISDIIKTRIKKANANYLSTDNISDFIKPGELDKLISEVEINVAKLLSSLIIDTKNDHNTQETAYRIAKMYIQDIFSGRYVAPPSIKLFPNAKKYDQLYVTEPITVRAVCAHHFQNISGSAFIGVFPGTDVIGLSKFNRIVDWYATRPTIQEELTIQIADKIQEITKAEGIAVVIKASHSCITARGVKEHNNDFTTSVVRGSIRNNPVLKEEFFALLSSMKGWSTN